MLQPLATHAAAAAAAAANARPGPFSWLSARARSLKVITLKAAAAAATADATATATSAATAAAKVTAAAAAAAATDATAQHSSPFTQPQLQPHLQLQLPLLLHFCWLDLGDLYCRCVCVFGIPFASLRDPRVQLKRRFLNEQHAKDPKGLSGSEWYTQEAIRAVNQAVGRVCRHSKDFGLIVLADCRWAAAAKQQNEKD
ncbi:hypothetical protein ETH_00003170 [Eimeria tenella]|uniref:ATP-dependent helicase C-terminal domain-containing protein n=1 Tax=Eimeria tenella TaxID=5802 RepID=U6KKP8_EIMTE|nr:hypothetical protein ETH_00003170 [Eimeria tenella]CDJ37371.1 hypothetical protein ETH_00003170 [Eimeria tenella]|eukprot:XP_013228209.1 hypothetical protein ETH_00003170 [Eimeria tenella]